MADSSLVNMSTLYFCSAKHVGCETVSTDIYKLMCKLHMPVYLFSDTRDEKFVTYHYHVSISLDLVLLKKIINNFLKKIVFNFFPFFTYIER